MICKKSFWRKAINDFILWLSGGVLYFYIEILFRGFSHYSMIICGGLCFLFVGKAGVDILYSTCRFKVPVIMGIGAFIITTLEFITGIVVNIFFDLKVWDYSDVYGNVMGQICLPYTFLWGALSLLCVYFTDMLERVILN